MNQEPRHKRRGKEMKPGRFTLLLYLAVIALAAEVVFLVIQNRRLQGRITAL